MTEAWRSRKVVIVGAGSVGSTFAYALAMRGLAEEIVLVDVNEELAKGQVLDLSHGKPFMPTVGIRVGRSSEYADANVIVITAGASQKKGESRLDLLSRNAVIVEQIMDEIQSTGSSAVIVVVTNPVDLLTQIAVRRRGGDRQRVFGSGTVLDSSRLRYLVADHCNVDIGNAHAYVLGEHGDSEVCAWSMAHIAGVPYEQFCEICRGCSVEERQQRRQQMAEQVKNSAYHIIDYKGATYYAVGLALVRIVEAVLRNGHTVLTVSTQLEGEYGLRDVCLSVPCVVGRNGIERIVEGVLTEDEKRGLQHSADVLRNGLQELDRSRESQG